MRGGKKAVEKTKEKAKAPDIKFKFYFLKKIPIKIKLGKLIRSVSYPGKRKCQFKELLEEKKNKQEKEKVEKKKTRRKENLEIILKRN